jgi:hypothetical protein
MRKRIFPMRDAVERRLDELLRDYLTAEDDGHRVEADRVWGEYERIRLGVLQLEAGRDRDVTKHLGRRPTPAVIGLSPLS